MDMVDPSDGNGIPGVDAYPAPEYNKQLRLDAGEQILSSYAASSFRVTKSDLKGAFAGIARWEPVDPNLDGLVGRSNGWIIVTNLRVVALISKLKMPPSSLLNPSEWLVKVMMGIDKDMKASIVAGHAPLESIIGVEAQKKSLGFSVALKTNSFERAFRVVANMQQQYIAAAIDSIEAAAKAQWASYLLPDAVAAAVQQPFPRAEAPTRVFSPLVRPLGGTAGFVGQLTRRIDPELPEELRYVEVGRTSVSAGEADAARAAAQAKVEASGADGSISAWTCAECGYAMNIGGRLRCGQCRRDTGHLAVS